MRYSCNVISRALRIAAITAPLVLGVASPSFAGSGGSEPAEVDSLRLQRCLVDEVVLTFEGLDIPSTIAGTVQFDSRLPKTTVNRSVTLADVDAGNAGSGSVTLTYPIPAKTKVIKVSLTYTLWDDTVKTVDPTKINDPVSQPFGGRIERADCPDLPVTGGNAAPIGKIALGTTLGGALLAAVAIRRRPRKHNAAA